MIDGVNHAYLGRGYITLKAHKPSLSSLSREEWADFEQFVANLEPAYKAAFGAEPLNWGCFMNHAFRTKPFNSHVHWHIFPRYEVAPVLNGITFEDPLFGEMYNSKNSRPVDKETILQIAAKLRENVS